MIAPENPESTRPCTERAPFLVGVTGYMDLVDQEIEPLKVRLRTLFHFLRKGGDRQRLDELATDLVPDKADKRLWQDYRSALSHWTGLGPETPIVVLCNLAPGVDTLVANLVLDEFAEDNFHLLCPLPFPPHIYSGASTFVRFKDGQPVDGNRERQQGFLKALARMNAIRSELVELATGEAEHSPELSDALTNVSPETFFAVRLAEDRGLETDALEQRWLDDRGDAKRCDLRYYAAGEFLTVTTHLLVAVWDGRCDGSRSGTSAVVNARLSGPSHGLLPTTSDAPLPHGGPVWHLLANRPSSSSANVETCAQSCDLALPPLRILHPYMAAERDCSQASIVAPRQTANIQLQRERLSLLARVGESMRNFNAATVPASKDREEEFNKRLSDPSGTRPLASLLDEQSPPMGKRLRGISDMYCHSSELTTHYQARVKQTLATLFSITLVAAVALHFFTHWHPLSEKKKGMATDGHAESNADPALPKEHLNHIQLAAGWVALGLTALAVGYFGWQRSRKLEAHWYDARAIAEGLRVQLYWNLAGLGKSVSANYMSRHRSELDWIRAVIRTTSLPYEIWNSWFAELPAATQLRAFRVVRTKWVQDQLGYFRKASHREHHRLHVWHKFGAIAALAGMLVYLKLTSGESWPAVTHFVEAVCHWCVAVFLLVVTGYVAWHFASRAAVRTAAAGHREPPIFPDLSKSIEDSKERIGTEWKEISKASRWLIPKRVAVWVWQLLVSAGSIALEIVYILIPTGQNSAITRTTFARRVVHSVLSFLAYLPLALVTACTACGICNAVATTFGEAIPGPLTLSIIAAGALLLSGALSVAWAEKNLHSEFAYQYNTMAILFQAADQQLDKQLTDFQTALNTDDVVAQRECIRRVQSLLFELGQEALDENAEWLLLHRARPLEPVMAG